MPPIRQLLTIMQTLRDPLRGCPWDLQQDFESIAPYTIEEAYEVADAIARQNLPDLRDELGDLLLQVVFHAQMASEQRAFDFDDVVEAISAKMIRRHPHVFAGHQFASMDEQKAAWEADKERERAAGGATSLMDGIPAGMAELQRSVKLQKRASTVGFDWENTDPVFAKLQEEVEELQEAIGLENTAEVEEELGDLMFVLTNLARLLKVDAAAALRRANLKFEERFREMEKVSGGRDNLDQMKIDEMEALWQQVKASFRDRQKTPAADFSPLTDDKVRGGST